MIVCTRPNMMQTYIYICSPSIVRSWSPHHGLIFIGDPVVMVHQQSTSLARVRFYTEKLPIMRAFCTKLWLAGFYCAAHQAVMLWSGQYDCARVFQIQCAILWAFGSLVWVDRAHKCRVLVGKLLHTVW